MTARYGITPVLRRGSRREGVFWSGHRHGSTDPGPHRPVDEAGKVTRRVNGTMFHIAVGRTHARTRIKLLVHDLDVTVIDASTGELLTELSIDPTRRYQPLNSRKPPNP